MESPVNNWSLPKQYLASHYFLSEEKPIKISEAQRSQLGALHLYVSHGPYTPNASLPELQKCTLAEKRKRIEEWTKLGHISKKTAMAKFIDLVNDLFPNWVLFKKLYSEFEEEWKLMQGRERLQFKHKSPRNLTVPAKQNFVNTAREFRDMRNRTIEQVEQFQWSRFKKKRDQFPLINAAKDAANILHKQRLYSQYSPIRKQQEESVYYRIPREKITRENRANTGRETLINEITDWRQQIISRHSRQENKILPRSPLHNSLHERIMEMKNYLEEL